MNTTLISSTTFLSPSSPHRYPPASSAPTHTQTHQTKVPSTNRQENETASKPAKAPKIITTRSASKSRYFMSGASKFSNSGSSLGSSSARSPKSTKPPLSSSSKPPLSTFLNYTPEKENLGRTSPALSEDSLSQFLRPNTPEHAVVRTYMLAGARLATFWNRIAVTKLLRAFLLWNRNSSHIKTSLICGSRILSSVSSRKSHRSISAAFSKWRHAALLYKVRSQSTSIYNARNTRLLFRVWKTIKIGVYRRCFMKWLKIIKFEDRIERNELVSELESLRIEFEKVGELYKTTKSMNSTLASRCLNSESNSVEYLKRLRNVNCSAAISKLEVMVNGRKTLGLIVGQDKSRKMLKALRLHPLSVSFRKWEAYNLACIYYERNREKSVNDTRNWLDDRVPRLESQNTNLNKCLQESKWSNSVLAKEVVRAGDTNSRLKIEIEDCYNKLEGHVTKEIELEREVTVLRGMLEGQVDKLLTLQASQRASPQRKPDTPPAASARGLSQSQNSLLAKLEREANQVMEGLGNNPLAMKDLADDRFDTYNLDPKILSEVRGSAVQGVLVTNSDGLDDMFRHYSRNQHTGTTQSKRKRSYLTVDSSEIRVMDEHGWIRCCKDMGMAKYLSVSKLLACFRSCSFTSDFEVKAVCDESGFCSSVACVAIVSRMGTGGKDGETARELVAELLSSIDPGAKFLKCPKPMRIGQKCEDMAWEIFLNYCGVLERKKGGGASLSSNNFSKFVKEFGLMRGVQSAGGKIDTVFQRVVSDRAMKSDNKKTAETKHTGTHSTRRSMAFDDFLVGLCGLARAKDFNRELEGVEDEAIVKEIIVTMIEQRAA
ncbi:hypothetical protein TrST_g13183 [Triparma strigata]|uniref:Uncharacterized protein n=1 Tax=Triparma strigata TaxID=1606541 RepID=A0A9W7BTD0_9STRA|nr:hypothetical protein TrST_g13183 [Triparma strigata]